MVLIKLAFKVIENGLLYGNDAKLWKATVWVFVYFIWSQRNSLVFKKDQRKLVDLFFEFQRKSYEWIVARTPNKKVEWNLWLSKPDNSV